jgi:hypothetical protein
MTPVSRNIASWRFLERLKNFRYMEWKAINPLKLEYVSLCSKPFRYMGMMILV